MTGTMTLTKPTDLERFIELYRSFGIECLVHELDKKLVIVLSSRQSPCDVRTISPKFGGYYGHCSDIWFTLEGAFIKQDFKSS